MTTAEAETRRRPGGRSARVRAAVLAATAEALAEVGYNRLSFDDVADRAGVHKTTLYRRWPGKAELVLDALVARSDVIVEFPDTGDLAADLLVFLRSVAANVESPLGHALVAATLRLGRERGELAGVRHQFWDQRFGKARARVEHAIEAGQLDAATDRELLLESLVSPIFFRTLVRGEPVDDEFLTALVRLHLR